MDKENIGGRAYTNGVKLMNKKYSVKAYYDENNKINYQISKIKNRKFIYIMQKIPVIRGIINLVLAITIFLKESINRPKKYWFIFLIIILDILYIYFLENEATSIVVGNILLILYYLIPICLLIIFRKKIKEVLKFHGAEHKAVNYYENNFKGKISDYSRLHRRCGSNLIFYYIIINLIANLANINLNLLLLQLIYLGLAYEAVRYTPEKLLFIPQLFQKIVTKEPETKHLKAAQSALNLLYKKIK